MEILWNNFDFVHSEMFPPVPGDPYATVERIVRAMRESPVPIMRIGVGTAGQVETDEQLVTAINLGWKRAPIKRMLRDITGIRTWVDNDAQTQLAAEWWDGACKGLQSVVYLTFGTGVGGAFLFNGRPWRGHTNTAGELGHFIIHADGLPCTCGMRGCYEAYASAGALCRMAKKDSAREIIDAARAGDEEMMAVFRAYLHEVAIGIASIYMLFCPQAIVLGGGISASGDILLHTLNEQLAIVAPTKAAAISKLLCLAMHRNDAGIRGAAALAATNL